MMTQFACSVTPSGARMPPVASRPGTIPPQILAIVMLLSMPAMAAPPDLTAGGLPTTTKRLNLGPTGAHGWLYRVNENSSESRQILVQTVDADSPAAGIPAPGDDATEDLAYSGTLDGSATDADDDTLEYAKVSGPAWLMVAADGTLSGTPANSDAGSNEFTVGMTDGNSTPVSATLNISVNPSHGKDYANADTHSGNNIYQKFRKLESSGNSDGIYSYLEHKWHFNVTGGTTVTFHMKAHHTANIENDHFIFAYLPSARLKSLFPISWPKADWKTDRNKVIIELSGVGRDGNSLEYERKTALRHMLVLPDSPMSVSAHLPKGEATCSAESLQVPLTASSHTKHVFG